MRAVNVREIVGCLDKAMRKVIKRTSHNSANQYAPQRLADDRVVPMQKRCSIGMLLAKRVCHELAYHIESKKFSLKISKTSAGSSWSVFAEE